MHPEFVRQTDQPLYPQVLYNRPVTRSAGGRLLIVGGHAGEFSLPTATHQFATAAGIGECTVVLPDSLAKLLGGAPGTAFAPATPAGSLDRGAADRILELSESADAVALGPSLSNNSATAMLAERLATDIERPLIVQDDALTVLRPNLSIVTDNPRALIIATMAEIFKIAGVLGVGINLRPEAGLINKLEIMHDVAAASRATYAVYGTELIVAAGAELTVTPINHRLALTPALFYGTLATFWLQNQVQPVAGLTTAAYLIARAGTTLGPTDTPTASGLATALGSALKQAEDL